MCGLRRLVLVAVGMATIFFVDQNCRPLTRRVLPKESTEPVDSFHQPIVLTESLDDVRKAELSRRARRPAGDPDRKEGLNYEQAWKGRKGARAQPKPAVPMSPTYCCSVEPVPKDPDPFSVPPGTDLPGGAYRAHHNTVALFETRSGFGFWRMLVGPNDRGVEVGSKVVDRVELVSLLTDYQPSVYVLDEMATPPLARQAKRRPLDEFERLGLDAVRGGEELLWTREAPTRMFGAIRARAHCLDCHANAKKGDLLGAFTYYLNAPVDKLEVWE